jgi:hypothetical protein
MNYIIGSNLDLYNAITDADAEHYSNLWGWCVINMPIRVDHNVCSEGRVVNGSVGTFKSIRPFNVEEFDTIISRSNWSPGDIITIKMPYGVVANIPNGRSEIDNENMTFKCVTNSVIRKKHSIVLGKDNNRRQIVVLVMGMGFVSNLSGTDYAFQGQTLPTAIIDIGISKNNTKLSLNQLLVITSRNKAWNDLYVMPLDKDSTPLHDFHYQSLLNMRFDDIYYIWNQCYDEKGIFQSSKIKPIHMVINTTLPIIIPERPTRSVKKNNKKSSSSDSVSVNVTSSLLSSSSLTPSATSIAGIRANVTPSSATSFFGTNNASGSGSGSASATSVSAISYSGSSSATANATLSSVTPFFGSNCASGSGSSSASATSSSSSSSGTSGLQSIVDNDSYTSFINTEYDLSAFDLAERYGNVGDSIGKCILCRLSIFRCHQAYYGDDNISTTLQK